ncbi:MAG: hypothetical protein IKO40_03725, partial [Kiritimatiellae bacterium]|nr:hypothetical protein [Kiritimatiellia bacterium]
GLILMNLELVPMPGNRLRTACTDGRRIMMSISFYAKLDLEERLFVMAHEAWHCVLMHGVRYQTRNQHLFNIAADLEIHFILQKEKMKEPFVLPHDPAWDGLSAEEIYEKLGHKSQRKSKNAVLAPHKGGIFPSSKGGGGPDDNGSFKAPGKQSEHIKGQENGEGFDEHSCSGGGEKPLEDTERGKCKEGNRASDGEKGKTSAAGKGGAGTDSQNDSDEQNGNKGGGNSENSSSEATSSDNGEKSEDSITEGQNSISETPAWDRQAVERMRRIVIQAAQIMERTQGLLPAHIQGIIEKLRKPELPWRELLRQFVTSCYGGSRRWLPPERRYVGRGIYLPSFRNDKLSNVVVAMDISGSMEWNLSQVFGELVSLLKSFGSYSLDILQCDTEITNVLHFDDNHPFVDYNIPIVRKTGGNCFMPVFNYIKKQKLNPMLLIYMTDGYLSTDDTAPPPKRRPPYPVLWVLTHNGQKPVTWGRCIKLKHSREN